jgi:N-methylhydantoinase A
MRYSGQSFELSVPIAMDVGDIAQIERAFSEVYAARYGAATGAAIEIVSYRLAAWGLSDKPQLPAIDHAGRKLKCAVSGRRSAVFVGSELAVTVFDRDCLPSGQAVQGPALIEEAGSTSVVPPGWSAELDDVGCLVLRRS